jgi:hypothetical protein
VLRTWQKMQVSTEPGILYSLYCNYVENVFEIPFLLRSNECTPILRSSNVLVQSTERNQDQTPTTGTLLFDSTTVPVQVERQYQ